VDHNRKVVTFSGSVDARRDDFIINCSKLLLYYLDQTDNNESGKTRSIIEKIVASGNVRITRLSGGNATAEKAVFHQDSEKLILTGNPVIKQGDNLIEGSTITVFLKENRSVVEGSEDIKARIVLVPGTE
jgi:lipopolysaccharide export system protein LptA